MADSRVFGDTTTDRPTCPQAGIISKIRLENFMCHSNLEIELGDRLNFITGQNGSGKSAILTALCVAFGSRAKGTQRANTMKDFIKTGCSYALVHVEIKNQGEDAFKPEIFGDRIIVERRISEASNSMVLKSHYGKKVASRKEDLDEVVDHFNIDVENPCVVMSQDKSREFLHSGSAKDKFKFFFKATLLHRLEDLLKDIENQLNAATELVDQLEKSLIPILKELEELQVKIKSMEHVEEITQQVQLLKKKLAWSWVYDVDKRLKEQNKLIEKLKGRVPACQTRIDQQNHKVEELTDKFSKKKSEISCIFEKTSEVRRKKDDLQQSLSLATREKLELEGECERKANDIQKMVRRAKLLQRKICEFEEQHIRDSQAEEFQMEEMLKEFQSEVNEANLIYERLKEEEDAISESLGAAKDEISTISRKLEDFERRDRDIRSQICEIQQHQTNKVTAFGGGRVTGLLQAIERHHHKFRKPPIGPIGAHVTLEQGETWAVAIENAVGRLLNAFIVTDHKDSLLLRACAREANYNHLQIIIYDFSRPKLNVPTHMLPQTRHPTVISVIHSDNPTVLNVLIDMGSAERQVLVKDYDAGKNVAFDQRVSNLKEVYTCDGYKMFSRGSAQTILPPNKNSRAGRLCGSFDNQIKSLERDAISAQEQVQQGRGIKRSKEEALGALHDKLQSVKRRRVDAERVLRSKEFKLRDMKKSFAAEANAGPTSTGDELHQEIAKIQEEIHEKEVLLEKLQFKLNEAKAKADDLRTSFRSLCDLAQEDIDALGKAEDELMMIEKDLHSAAMEKKHFEHVMSTKVLSDIEVSQTHYRKLEQEREENCRKASIICPENEIDSSEGGNDAGPEQLSAQLRTLNQRLQRESQRFSESIDELRLQYEKKERRIVKKKQNYKAFREKLDACKDALHLRWSKFQRNATLLKRQLTWQFNAHLKKKGISGHIKVSYEEQTLSIEVKMPQDASSSSVRDTRGLSGGERSFSTLCFALALHEMIEAPFRAMDEFDVFMDAVSRKISLDAIVDFALSQGSQWIFITPHDISMVKHDQRIKKQQMAAPRA